MVVLIVLDGFGVTQYKDSTLFSAKRPNFQYLEKFFPFTTLQSSGIAAGLAWGEEGNSEVGHLLLGSGKIIYHYLPRISVAIQDGSFFEIKAFKKAKEHLSKTGGRVHLLGLFSSGSVHAYPDHLYALLEFFKKEKAPEVFLHLFTDGRDSPPKEAGNFINFLKERILKLYPFAKIASLVGRDFSMDRDGNWDRIEKTYNLLVRGEGDAFKDAVDYLSLQYEDGFGDEFIPPGFLQDGGNSRIKSGDAVIFYNFREDSIRELASSFLEPGFDRFSREKLENVFFATMTRYHKDFSAKVAFEPMEINQCLSRVLSENNLKQLHIAETDKYAHVTYFFNGGRESPFPGEERILVPSFPGSRYDEHPEMSSQKITEVLLSKLKEYDFILANFANADIVGHTGNFEATVKAIETLDAAVGQIFRKVLEENGILIITADHGNAEEKRYLVTGEKKTKHSLNPVPFFLIRKEFQREEGRSEEEIYERYGRTEGVLSDVAPTVLELMKIPKPSEMTGVSLLPKLLEI